MESVGHLGVDRGLIVSKLTANSARPIVANIVREQLKMIDTKIATAHASGFNQISHDLPVNFGTNSMSKADAQIMVYSEIMLLLTEPEESGGKGFPNSALDVAVTGDKATVHVRWENGMDDDEKRARRSIIARYSLGKKSK